MCKSLNVLTRFHKCLLNPSSKSVVLKLFHVKDPQSYMYFGRGPPSQNMLFQGPPQMQRFELQKFALKNIYSKIFQKIHDFSKIADLQAVSLYICYFSIVRTEEGLTTKTLLFH